MSPCSFARRPQSPFKLLSVVPPQSFMTFLSEPHRCHRQNIKLIRRPIFLNALRQNQKLKHTKKVHVLVIPAVTPGMKLHWREDKPQSDGFAIITGVFTCRRTLISFWIPQMLEKQQKLCPFLLSGQMRRTVVGRMKWEKPKERDLVLSA